MGCFNLMSGVGSFIGAGLLLVLKPVLFEEKHNEDINDGHMQYLFFLLAGLEAVACILFVVMIKTKLKS